MRRRSYSDTHGAMPETANTGKLVFQADPEDGAEYVQAQSYTSTFDDVASSTQAEYIGVAVGSSNNKAPGTVGGLPLSIDNAGSVNAGQIGGTNQTGINLAPTLLLAAGTVAAAVSPASNTASSFNTVSTAFGTLAAGMSLTINGQQTTVAGMSGTVASVSPPLSATPLLGVAWFVTQAATQQQAESLNTAVANDPAAYCGTGRSRRPANRSRHVVRQRPERTGLAVHVAGTPECPLRPSRPRRNRHHDHRNRHQQQPVGRSSRFGSPPTPPAAT